MTIKDLKNFYGVKSTVDLAKKVGVSRVTIWKWEKRGIPQGQQAVFEINSGGQLKADLLQAS